ncbi:MAG: glycosyltransferase family 2 protein [Verrucomicrobia bacterium]|nr:glycosyltransferase family 2 protein [Verrucomicrobiota bacterium]
MPDISVIIVSWNARGYLRDCLISIRDTGGNCIREVIVVDNASSDGSPEMVAEQFPEVTLVSTGKNLGFARANNLGIKRATGSYLALVNSDVVVHQDCFQKLQAFMEAHSDVGLVGPKVFGRDGLLQRTCRRLPGAWNMFCEMLALDRVFSRWPLFSGREMRHWDQQNLAEVEVLSGCFWVARTSAVKKVGGLDERFFFYAEDIDWCKGFRDAGWRVMFVPEATATHFGGGSSSNAPFRYSIEMLRANLTYWKKHHGLPGMALYHLVSVIHYGVRVVPLALLKAIPFSLVREHDYKLKENFVCVRWLLTGVGV